MATINFKGKEIVRNYHLSGPYHELVPDEKKSLTEKVSLNDNLIIHGDNLLALKALLPTYAGKVNCVFIDPPYNLGEENWVYNDNVSSPMMKEWLGKVVGKDDLARHDKWLCMMMPRLKLLRELMHDDAAIFITLDDTEIHRCKLLMDEIFDESNFVMNIVWQSRKSVQNDTDLSLSHNHVLVYAKNRRQEERRLKESNKEQWFSMPGFVFRPLELDKSKFSNTDNDSRGPWKADPFDAPGVRKNLSYTIVNPITKEKFKPPTGRHWRTEEPKYRELLKDKRIVFGKFGKSGPQLKVFWEEKNKFGEVETSWWGEGATEVYIEEGIDQESAAAFTNYGTTTKGSQLLQTIFDGEKVFNNPKPIELVQHILTIAATKETIVLDSFAGSGTTAHAVLALNKEDGGKRRFVLVQIPEEIEEDKPAYKLGFRNIIDITAERVRRVIRGTKGARDEDLRKGLGGSFSYYELGDSIGTERILKGVRLPSFTEMARYIFYTATGEEFDAKKADEDTGFIGESQEYRVYLLYKPDIGFLKSTALTLERAEALGKFTGKKRLVFGPAKYLDQEHLERLHIDFAQLPFEIYQKQ
jgi:adenine-specific DNA-methyltransferase